MAEFDDPDELLAATQRAYDEGYRQMDAYTPFPVHGLSEALGMRHTRLPVIVLIGGLAALIAGYGLQYWVNVIEYPYNIGGRPFHSWPAFLPVTFETTVLLASLSAVLGMLGLNGLPQPYHPVFNASRFELASRTHFFLCVEATDPQFDRVKTREFLESLSSREVEEVDY